MLVAAREAAGTLLAVRLSSSATTGTGSGSRSERSLGPFRARVLGRLDRVPRLHDAGMRREACALDRMRFDLVWRRLGERYGWS